MFGRAVRVTAGLFLDVFLNSHRVLLHLRGQDSTNCIKKIHLPFSQTTHVLQVCFFQKYAIASKTNFDSAAAIFITKFGPGVIDWNC